MLGDRTVRLLSQPFLEDPSRFVDFTERAVRYRQQSACFGGFGLNVMTFEKQRAASCVRF